MIAPEKREFYLHWFFAISLLMKGAFAVGEIAAGIAGFIVPPDFVLHLVRSLVRSEVTGDPRDLIAHYLLRWARELTASSKWFVAWYLLSHGAVKLWLIVGLLRERLWYYPIAIVVFGLFIVYQLYRYGHTHSPWLVLLTAVDFVVIGLTWHEYRYLRRIRKLPV